MIRRLVPPLVACVCALAAGCSSESREPRQAVLILLDAARDDRLSCYGHERTTTPNIDALAAKGVVFRNHYSQGTYTRSALPTLFYSRYFVPPLFPSSERVPLSNPRDLFLSPDAEAISIPRACASLGMKTAIVSAHSWIREGTAFAREFDETYDLSTILEFDASQGYPAGKDVIDFALRWVEKHADEDFFLYVHLMDPHFPHPLGEDAKDYLRSASLPAEPHAAFDEQGYPLRGEVNAEELAYLNALYDGSMTYVDREMGRLFDGLDEMLSAKPLVAITSDHGEFLFDRPGLVTHGGPWYEPVARIPLVISYPGKLPPGEVVALTESVDVLPTFLALFGEELSGKSFDGDDLSELAGAPTGSGIALTDGAILQGGWKAIFETGNDVLLGEETPDPADLVGELYAVKDDPLERVDLWGERHDEVARLLELYRTELRGPYRRYADTRGKAQPTSPFALGFRHATPVPAVTSHCEEPEIVAWLSGGGTGWMRMEDGKGQSLVGARGSTPLEVSFSVPDGRYAVSVGLRGAARITLAQPEEGNGVVELASRDQMAGAAEQLECGVVEVRGQTFRARIEADTRRAPLVLRHFGFRPLVDGIDASASAADDDLVERLRALGYVDSN